MGKGARRAKKVEQRESALDALDRIVASLHDIERHLKVLADEKWKDGVRR